MKFSTGFSVVLNRYNSGRGYAPLPQHYARAYYGSAIGGLPRAAAAQTVVRTRCLQVLVLVGKRHVLRGLQLGLVLRNCALVDDDLRRLEGRRLDEDQVGVAAGRRERGEDAAAAAGGRGGACGLGRRVRLGAAWRGRAHPTSLRASQRKGFSKL